MTIHITALGALIAWGWISFLSSVVLILTSASEGKAGRTAIYFAEAVVLLFIMVNL